MSLKNLVWEQKYRPLTIADTILPAQTRKAIEDIMANGNIPNFVFYGTAGIGKTTLAQAIAAETGADLLFINASLSGNIDTLRTDITQFVSSVSLSDSDTKKIVVLDEADYLNAQSTQPALRGFIDEFSSNAIFILTCNYKERLIEPLRDSRMTPLEFKFTKEDRTAAAMQMLKRACTILDTEGVTYDKKAVAALITKCFPDFRKTLNALQFYSASGTIDSGILVNNDATRMEELVAHVKAKEFGKCRQWVANNQTDSQSFYRGLYDRMLPLLVPATVPQVILIIADRQAQSRDSVDQEINQIASLIQIMQAAVFK